MIGYKKECFMKIKIMEKKIFESNMVAIKENKTEFKDTLRVFASVCHIVDAEFCNPREINNSKFQDDFNKIQKQEYDYLTSRYHVYTRDGLIQTIMKELGYEDEDMLITLTTGKLEVEETIKEIIGLNNLPSTLFN